MQKLEAEESFVEAKENKLPAINLNGLGEPMLNKNIITYIGISFNVSITFVNYCLLNIIVLLGFRYLYILFGDQKISYLL